MYHKIINGTDVISACKTIHLESDHSEFGLVKGQWVSNPSEALILAEGWEIHNPIINTPTEEERKSEEYQQMLADTQDKMLNLLESYFAEHGTGKLASLAQERQEARIFLDNLGKLKQTTTGTGSAFDPIKYWNEGMEVTEGLWYQCHDENGYIWEAIKSGIPANDMDTDYFDVVS